MTPFAWIALVGWPLLVIALFSAMPGRRAATFAVVGAWLLLPPYVIPISGLPDYSKQVAATVGMMLGTLLFAPGRLISFRPRWFDLPMAVWCFTGMFASLSNGLGLYDGLSDALGQIIVWGLPYLLGRLYFGTLDDLRYFIVAMVVGGLFYVPLCLFEIRMSPRLLGDVYGISHWQGIRLGGYRPHVFFWTGLECGMWMTAASLSGWWLWRCGALKRVGSYAFGPLLVALLVTNVLCRSTGALLLFLGGVVLQWLTARFRTKLFMTALILAGPLYVGVRALDLWSGQQAVDLAAALVGPDRAESLGYRFMCERLIADHALKQPIFGWGGFTRALVYFDAERTRIVPPDGLWVGTLSGRGTVGLVTLYLVLGLPAIRFIRGFPARSWGDPRVAAATLAVALLGLYIVNCLMNAFVNIIYITLAGGLMGIDWASAHAALGAASGASGRRGAGRAARAASGSGPLAERWRALGRSLKQEGRLDEADDAWRRALDLLAGMVEADPAADGPRRRWCDCANDLAWLQANHPDPARRDAASAAALARRAADEYPESAAYWNTLGAAYYRGGDPHAAIEALEQRTRPLRRHRLRRRAPRHGPTPGRRRGGGPPGAGRRHAAGGARSPGAPRVGGALRRGPHPDRRRGGRRRLSRGGPCLAQGRRSVCDPRRTAGRPRRWRSRPMTTTAGGRCRSAWSAPAGRRTPTPTA